MYYHQDNLIYFVLGFVFGPSTAIVLIRKTDRAGESI